MISKLRFQIFGAQRAGRKEFKTATTTTKMYPAGPPSVAKTGGEMHVKPSLNEVTIKPVTNDQGRKFLDVKIKSTHRNGTKDKSKDEDNDNDNCSIYSDNDDEDRDDVNHITTGQEKECSPRSPAASSYDDLASLNPYIVDIKALNRPRITLHAPTEVELRVREDRHREDLARLAWELDSAHAAIVREEFAALQALKRQVQLAT